MRFSMLRFNFLALLVSFACLCAQQAKATTVCVDNAADLYEDLQMFSDGGGLSGDDLEIDLVIGSYKVGSATGNQAFTYYSTASTGYISIIGGWRPNCTEQVPGATDVSIDGNNKAQALVLDDNLNPVVVSTVVIQNAKTDKTGGGLAINTNVAKGGSVQVEDCIIQNNHTSAYVGGLAAYASGAENFLDVSDNLIINNSADGDEGGGLVDGTSVYNMNVANNTVYGNTTSNGTVGGLYVGSTVKAESAPLIASNIFDGNTHTGLYLSGTPPYVQYNDYGSIAGVTPAGKTGNVSESPKFVDAAGGDFHLSGTSPLIGLTTEFGNCDPDDDLDGHTRPYYSACDPGAYAETIYTSGFESQ
jgi:hypothetical protein